MRNISFFLDMVILVGILSLFALFISDANADWPTPPSAKFAAELVKGTCGSSETIPDTELSVKLHGIAQTLALLIADVRYSGDPNTYTYGLTAYRELGLESWTITLADGESWTTFTYQCQLSED
jgi:hypothetical protein